MAKTFKLDLPKPKTAGSQEQEFVPSEHWINIGHYDLIDGEEVFVSLTKGIPVDTLKPMKGNSEIARRKNRLNGLLAEALFDLEPGETIDFTNLVIQGRRIAPQETEVDETETTLHTLTFVKKAKAS